MDQVYLIDNKELTIHSTTIKPVWSDADFVLIRDPNVTNGTYVATTSIVYAADGSKVELIPDTETETESATRTVSKRSKESAEATN